VERTTIPHADFDDPECCGCLAVIVRDGIAEFTCNECGAVVACAREADLSAALHALELSVGVATAICPHCRYPHLVVGLSTVKAFVCERCGAGVTVR
jgi:hypothetical protein